MHSSRNFVGGGNKWNQSYYKPTAGIGQERHDLNLILQKYELLRNGVMQNKNISEHSYRWHFIDLPHCYAMVQICIVDV